MTFFIWMFIIYIIIYIFSHNIFFRKNKSREKTDLYKNNNFESSFQNYKIEKGKIGEQIIVDSINESIDIYHKIIRNVILEKNGKKTEVDIILITCVGIYVIESKNFKGCIYGKDTDSVWTQWFPNKKDSFIFDNPINQNEYHIEFMAHNLNLDPSYFYSYIVFGNDAKLQKIILTKLNLQVNVLNEKNLIQQLRKDMHFRDIVLSHEQIDKMYLDLEYFYFHFNR